jgi:rhodanese-related sulfurtransferase
MCHGGGRSRRVAEFLTANGFEHVFNLRGGIDAWSQQIDPGVPRY